MNRVRSLRALLAVVVLATFASVGGAALSPNNPYRSFNSGINYGAQMWERTHHGHAPHGLFRGRR